MCVYVHVHTCDSFEHVLPLWTRKLASVKVRFQRAMECCLLLGKLSHEVTTSHILGMRGWRGGKGRKKKRRKKPPNSSLFIISMSKQPYVMYVSHMYVKSGCTECLRNNNVNCIDEEGMYSS